MAPGKPGLSFDLPARITHFGWHPDYQRFLLLLQLNEDWKGNDAEQQYHKDQIVQLDPICVIRDMNGHYVVYNCRDHYKELDWRQRRFLDEHPNFPW